jgi:hypothetical protein
MKILFGSIVRNGESYIRRYFDQISNLTKDFEVGVFITEGDSTDNSYQTIMDNALSTKISTMLFKYNHGGNLYGSVNVKERWENIAATWNFMLDRITSVLDQYDLFCYVEADLMWNKETILQLANDCLYFDAVAPMSMLGGLFYDTWGHRAFGESFSNTQPYHTHFDNYPVYMPLQSAGSCIMMQSKVAKICRLSPIDAMIGHDIIKNKFSFVLNKEIAVYHP